MSEKKPSAGIYTLGCKVNQYESEAIAEELERGGVTVLPPTEVCDAYVINTCTVTAESDRKARQFIRRAIARNPKAYIVVTGCLAQTAPDSLRAISGIDSIVGNTKKLGAAHEVMRLLKNGEKPESAEIHVESIEDSAFEPMQIKAFERTRAYIKIEDGCENRCTYCIIPNARGKVRSKLPEDVISEVTRLTCSGCREVVLTGIETASYGKDLSKGDLTSLLESIDKIEGIGRVRLGSLDPSMIREDIAARLGSLGSLGSLAPHFHLSLQSGSSRVLALMKRKYNARQAMRSIELLREHIPNVQFTTDVIVGFPGETDEDFAETVEFCKKARFLMVHIFPYSPRRTTPAASMSGQIPEDVKRKRLHELEAVVSEIRRELCEEKLSRSPVCEVLFETYENGVSFGHTADFFEIAVPSERPMHGELASVRLERTDGKLCYGVLCHSADN